ncbi:MAG: response regulator [Lentisphaerae bacterium]|nr:response regulator [Lentisphaerota bacterium]
MKRVMIVDNDEAWIRSLKLLLTERGYEVYAFTDPSKACDFIDQMACVACVGESEMPDAVVLDYLMPEMSGYQVLGRMGYHLSSSCRIVFVTGHGEQLRNAKLGQMGVAACLAKPVDLDGLVAALEGQAA